jgi:hypothetical protein
VRGLCRRDPRKGAAMITLTREEAQELFDVVEAADKVLVTAAKFGGNPKKGYVTILIKDYAEVSLNLRKQLNKIETLRARLSAPEHIVDERKKVCQRCGEVNPAEIHTCSPQQQEPVAYLVYDKGASNQYLAFDDELGDMDGCDIQPLYTAAPQREWQGLTDEDIRNIAAQRTDFSRPAYEEYYIAIEQALKDKNT